MIKKISKGLLSLLVIGIIGVSSIAWYYSTLLLYPSPGSCSLEHYVYCKTPEELGMEFDDITLVTEDGLTLQGWFIPGDFKKAGIVMVHGRNASRHEALRDAIALHNQGFNLVLIDLRHSGISQRQFNSMGYHERKDVHSAVSYLKDQQHIESIGVVGYSMGASTAVMAMAENKNIKAGWFDSGFTDLDAIILEAGERDYGIPKMIWFTKLVRTFYELRGDLDTEIPTPISAISRIAPRPVMIVHGTADRVVDVSHGKRLFAAAQEPKSLWIVPDGRHTRAWQADREKSVKLISDFFLNSLVKKDSP